MGSNGRWPRAKKEKGGGDDETRKRKIRSNGQSNRFPLIGLGIENDRATEKSYRARQNLKYGMLSVANQTIKDLPRA